jgi:hypothetical protein
MSTSANLFYEIIDRSSSIRNISYEFNNSIISNLFFKNKDYLILSSKNVKFKNNWQYNPQLFCHEFYEISELYPVILLVNNLNSIFEFKAEVLSNTVIAPSLSSIYNVFLLQS